LETIHIGAQHPYRFYFQVTEFIFTIKRDRKNIVCKNRLCTFSFSDAAMKNISACAA
jgi:hypothetical protein